MRNLPTLLRKLEDEAISIIRDSFSKSFNPVMMYSIGKDSSVLLHLMRKAFYPSSLPLPLLHIDTKWKFKQMYFFKKKIVKKYKLKIITHTNFYGVKKKISPFNNNNYTQIMKTDALKEALNKYKFDIIYGGARRDEEPSRSKERVVSIREENHSWDPKNQRAEVFQLYNYHKFNGQSFRIFPLSNWTEEDVWNYIKFENIEIVDLYFSKLRPTVNRNGAVLMVDDKRFSIKKKEKVIFKNIRFRTLGCYPLTAATLSKANTISQIILENKRLNYSERVGRLIDHDNNDSMEKKKRNGYF
jgi:sulfate adenylyltransferase subunit 2